MEHLVFAVGGSCRRESGTKAITKLQRLWNLDAKATVAWRGCVWKGEFHESLMRLLVIQNKKRTCGTRPAQFSRFSIQM
jgi:hypothetical protein